MKRRISLARQQLSSSPHYRQWSKFNVLFCVSLCFSLQIQFVVKEATSAARNVGLPPLKARSPVPPHDGHEEVSLSAGPRPFWAIPSSSVQLIALFLFSGIIITTTIRAKVRTLQTSVVWSISLDHRLQAADQINHIFILIFYCFYKQIKSIRHPHLFLLLHPIIQGIKIQNVASTGQVKTRFRISPGDGKCPWRTNSNLEF